MIRINKLNKYYNKDKGNELHVLKDVDFSLDSGEYVAIMGKSGVGKSTLLNIIGGLENFESGEYYFDDKDIKNASKSKLDKLRSKEISFVFQEYLLIEEDTVLDNVKVPLIFDKKYKYSEMDRVAKEAILKAGLDESMFNKKCSQLSGGQKQRVAIARAIVNKPKLILADEPTGSVDEKTSQEILGLFDKLVSDNFSIIVVTHDRDVAEHTQKTYTMVDGRFE